jgi:hypothetical protein
MQTERSGTQGPLHTCTQNHVRLDHVTTVCGFGLVRIANARVKTSDVHACTGFASMTTWMRGVASRGCQAKARPASAHAHMGSSPATLLLLVAPACAADLPPVRAAVSYIYLYLSMHADD